MSLCRASFHQKKASTDRANKSGLPTTHPSTLGKWLAFNSVNRARGRPHMTPALDGGWNIAWFYDFTDVQKIADVGLCQSRFCANVICTWRLASHALFLVRPSSAARRSFQRPQPLPLLSRALQAKQCIQPSHTTRNIVLSHHLH